MFNSSILNPHVNHYSILHQNVVTILAHVYDYIHGSSIVNDVIFNNRVQLTDRAALTDSMRSLQAMLNDFLKEYR